MAIDAIEVARDSSVDELLGWRAKLLFSLAHLDEGATPERVVEGWVQSWTSDARPALPAGLTTAIQRHLGLAHAARYLVEALEERAGE